MRARVGSRDCEGNIARKDTSIVEKGRNAKPVQKDEQGEDVLKWNSSDEKNHDDLVSYFTFVLDERYLS